MTHVSCCVPLLRCHQVKPVHSYVEYGMGSEWQSYFPESCQFSLIMLSCLWWYQPFHLVLITSSDVYPTLFLIGFPDYPPSPWCSSLTLPMIRPWFGVWPNACLLVTMRAHSKLGSTESGMSVFCAISTPGAPERNSLWNSIFLYLYGGQSVSLMELWGCRPPRCCSLSLGGVKSAACDMPTGTVSCSDNPFLPCRDRRLQTLQQVFTHLLQLFLASFLAISSHVIFVFLEAMLVVV